MYEVTANYFQERILYDYMMYTIVNKYHNDHDICLLLEDRDRRVVADTPIPNIPPPKTDTLQPPTRLRRHQRDRSNSLNNLGSQFNPEMNSAPDNETKRSHHRGRKLSSGHTQMINDISQAQQPLSNEKRKDFSSSNSLPSGALSGSHYEDGRMHRSQTHSSNPLYEQDRGARAPPRVSGGSGRHDYHADPNDECLFCYSVSGHRGDRRERGRDRSYSSGVAMTGDYKFSNHGLNRTEGIEVPVYAAQHMNDNDYESHQGNKQLRHSRTFQDLEEIESEHQNQQPPRDCHHEYQSKNSANGTGNYTQGGNGRRTHELDRYGYEALNSTSPLSKSNNRSGCVVM